jgi:hypothetical protein
MFQIQVWQVSKTELKYSGKFGEGWPDCCIHKIFVFVHETS